MSAALTITTAVLAWMAFVLVGRWLAWRYLRCFGPGDPGSCLLWLAVRAYARTLHRVRHRGLEELRVHRDIGPLIVVSNHTGAVDPLLIQAGCRFEIRWMMARDMMGPSLDWLWKRQRIIGVSRSGSDGLALRDAIRHVKAGGVVGIFPEGRIVNPPRQVRPFFTGVGLLVSRARAPVMVVWVSGTPDTTDLLRSLVTPSRARVEFVDVLTFDDDASPESITQAVRERLGEASGWPLNNDPMPPLERERDAEADMRPRLAGTMPP